MALVKWPRRSKKHGRIVPFQATEAAWNLIAVAKILGLETPVINPLPWGLLQKTQTSKLPNLATCARAPFWPSCAGQRRIGPGQITDGT